MTSKTYCPMPWMHLHVAVDGTVQPCCIGKSIGKIQKNSLEEIWNGDTMKNIRLKMLNNEEPTECSKCFTTEQDLSSESLRIHSIQEYGKYVNPELETQSDGSLKDMKLRYIDFRFNNLCNFKCRICNPMYSSNIGSEIVAFHKIDMINVVNKNGPILYEELKKQYDNVARIYFAGGEPIMQREHFQVLKDLIESGRAKDIGLMYSTNGSKFKNGLGNMFEYWPNFKEVTVVFSLDGYGKPAEYWRSGTNWADVEENIRNVKQYDNIEARVHSVVGWPNVFNWIEFIKYALETDLIDNLLSVAGVTPINDPYCYALSAAPDFKKKAIVKELNKLKEYVWLYISYTKYIYHAELIKSIDTLINSVYVSDVPLLKKQFMLKNTRLDTWRDEDFFTAFPEHEDMRPYIT